MRIYLDFLGCRLNEAELEQWGRAFAARGHIIAATPADADICILNTCAVTREAARQSRQRIRRLHQQNPRAHLVVAGCDATYEPFRLETLPGVALLIPNREKSHLVERVLDTFDGQTTTAITDGESQYIFPHTRTRAFLKVQEGCNNRCTFCIVRILRGRERSRPVDHILADIRDLRERGYREVVLTGVHLGAYGRDQGSTLEGLVRHILRETDIERIRLSSLEPWDIPTSFFSLWEESGGRLMPHLHLPLQSGSDVILRRMGRRYTTAEYRALIQEAREHIPDLTLTTDIIVGFPGETEQDFQATLALVEEISFAHIHIFTYSPREGTPAARLPDQIPHEEKKRRSRVLHTLMQEQKLRYLSSLLGQTRPVLWEHVVAEDHETRTWSGLTDNYIRVHARVARSIDLWNQITDTHLEAVDEGQRLIGRVVGT